MTPDPKAAASALKPRMFSVPPETLTLFGEVFEHGAQKHGLLNFRTSEGPRASTYYDAAMRHLLKWRAGTDLDVDSGLPHLLHAAASLFILVDLLIHNPTAIDDRKP